jgi:DNA replication protein DnaC
VEDQDIMSDDDDDDSNEIMDRIFPRGEYPCTGKCGTIVERSYGMCAACAKREKQKEIETTRIAKHRLAQSAIPPRFRGWATFETEVPKIVGAERVTRAKAAIDSLDEWPIVLTGPAASGKTALACAMLHYAIAGRDLRGGYSSVPRLANARRDAHFGAMPESIKFAIDAPLLVLDDIGTEGKDEAARATLREVVWARYDNKTPTIFTTARDQGWIVRELGDGVAHRMFDNATEIGWPWGQ